MTLPPPPPAPRLTLLAFEPLWPAEQVLLRAALDGSIAKIGYRRPLQAPHEVQVRAEFLAFLAQGGGAHARIAGGRLQLLGACIVGRFDLRHQRVPASLWFYRCVFTAAPQLSGANFNDGLSFRDCELPGLQAEGVRVGGELELNAGCSVRGELVLARARIGRDLNLERLQLHADTSGAELLPCRLDADGLQAGGDVILSGGVQAAGELNFTRARIRGDLCASGARLSAPLDAAGVRGAALILDRARIGGHVLLDGGFSVAGQIRFQRVRVGGDLDCNGADFDVVGDASWGDAAAVLMDRARIGGTLNLQNLQRPLEGTSLVDARAGALLDDAQTWGSHHSLEGFAYARFAPAAPTDAPMRLGWLATQRGEEAGFRPEPWRRAIKVLRRMGRDDSAAEVAIGREDHLRRHGLIGLRAPPALRWLPRAGHALFGLFAGYGHRPLRLVAASAVLWLACAGAYWAAADDGVMASTQPASAGHATAFQPLVYSLDLLLPLVDLHQQRRWAPLATDDSTATLAATIQALTWIEALCGWLAALTLAAIASGVTDRDRQRG
ncbi:MAG TPA: pentapeptide repeat-containing protein [Burkholderiaceae bacterium]